MAVLRIDNLTKIFGGTRGIPTSNILKGISMNIAQGEFVGIMGPSGSGKTTLLNIISGIDTPTLGSVELFDSNISSMSKDSRAVFRRKNLGMIFQNYNLLESLTIKENILLPMSIDKNNSKIIESRAELLMDFFMIRDIQNKFPYNVSGGQQQRAAACRALINDPPLILADEPTGNLDSKSAQKFMKYMQSITENRNKSILMVTHDPYAASFCQRIIFLQDGKLYSQLTRKGSQKEFFGNILDSLALLGGTIYEV